MIEYSWPSVWRGERGLGWRPNASLWGCLPLIYMATWKSAATCAVLPHLVLLLPHRVSLRLIAALCRRCGQRGEREPAITIFERATGRVEQAEIKSGQHRPCYQEANQLES